MSALPHTHTEPAPFNDELRGDRRIVWVMGTVFSLDVRDLDLNGDAINRVVDWWQWVDATFSTYRSGSAISQLADGRCRLEDCPPTVREVLALCREAEASSGGYFATSPAGYLDPTGLVKGWSVEVASGMLREAGSRVHCIAAGGDLRCAGEPSVGVGWRLGIADPFDRSRVAAVVTGKDLAVATSGSAERGHHIIDPITGQLATDLASVTIVGDDLTRVDAMATAAFAMGARCRDWLEGLPDFSALVVSSDGATWVNNGRDRRSEIRVLDG